MKNISFLIKLQLFIVGLWMQWLNFWLEVFRKILFFRKIKEPKNILIYKIGNIGDIICAVPSFVAVRRAFPEAKLTLLTSSGKKGSLGAKDLLTGVWYIDELKAYYAEDINSFRKKINFISELKKKQYDLFIQLPDDLVDFRTLSRNIFFAKFIGAKSAFGFKIRAVQLFKKNQVDYLSRKTETESLLDILKDNGISADKVEFNFNISQDQKKKAENLLEKKWGRMFIGDLTVAFGLGCKRLTNQWPIERFAEVAKYLNDKYGAKIIIVGGPDDISKAEIIRAAVGSENLLIAAGELDILETIELLRNCSFLIANSTGTIHLAAAIGLPAIGLFSVRDVFGRWFPYGSRHKILYHKFIGCDYRKEDCIGKSMEMISIEEVEKACDGFLNK